MNLKSIAEWLLVIIMSFVICHFILSTFAYGQEPELGKWRWAEDTLQPTDDKQVHGVGSFGLISIIHYISFIIVLFIIYHFTIY